jgi:hypothetical protein
VAVALRLIQHPSRPGDKVRAHGPAGLVAGEERSIFLVI